MARIPTNEDLKGWETSKLLTTQIQLVIWAQFGPKQALEELKHHDPEDLHEFAQAVNTEIDRRIQKC